LLDVQTASSPGRRSSDILVLLKAADVLDVMAAARRPLGHSEIARLTGLNKTTSHRILSTLLSRDFVEQGADQRYHIGIRLFEIGNALRPTLSWRERVLPIIRQLADDSEESVFLAVREGRRAVCLDRIEGKYASSLVWQLGGSLPLHIGAAPRVLLAELSDSELNDYLAGDLEAMTPLSVVDPAAIRKDVESIRGNGGVVAIDDTQIGTLGFGAAVRDGDGRAIAAISISGLSLTVPADRAPALFELVKDAAARASAALGFRAGTPNPDSGVVTTP
jgi:DNA-binding IclR family transcriptional regulator